MNTEHPTAWEAANYMPADVRLALSNYLVRAQVVEGTPEFPPILAELLVALTTRTDEANKQREDRLREAADLRRLAGEDPAKYPNVEFELQLGPSLSAKDRKWIKESGGHYSEVRGNQQTRFVHLPNSQVARGIAVRLLNAHQDGRVVIRFMSASVVLYRKMGADWDAHRLLSALGKLGREALFEKAARIEANQ